MRWLAVGTGTLVIATALGMLAVVSFQEHQQIQQQQAQLEASCGFYRDLGTAPLPVSTPSGKPVMVLGVRLVIHSRVAFTGQRCPGSLPPPGPGLVKWASYYKIPLH
jgi:hypothetical protein